MKPKLYPSPYGFRRSRPIRILTETGKAVVAIIVGGIIGAILLYAACGCASPYQGQAQLLTQQYQRGEMSAAEYQANMTNLEALELQRRANVGQAWNNFATGMQRQQYLNQMNQPRTFYIYNR